MKNLPRLNRRQLLQYSLSSCLLALMPQGQSAWANPGVPARLTLTGPNAGKTPGLSSSQVAQRLKTLRARVQRVNPPTKEVLEAMQRFPGPVLMYDLAQVEENFLEFKEADHEVEVYYAVKCCPNPRVLQRIAGLGGGFDFASPAELDLALATGVNVEKCIYSNTVKPAQDIRYAYSKGVRAFVADSDHEVRKLAEQAPGSLLYLRMAVDSKLAAHPLGDKFGTTRANAVKLLRLGRELGLKPYGTHFHVGTQCAHAEAWLEPTREAASVFRELAKEGIHLEFFDLGGGYPADYQNYPNVPRPKEILAGVRQVLAKELPGTAYRLAVEPGRAMVATAGVVGGRVLLRAERATGEWVHLDVGVYQGLFDTIDKYVYDVSVPGRTGAPAKFTVCGPTCDSFDVISQGQELPSDIDEGDFVVFHNSAAYSEACDTYFNGMAPPTNHYLDEVVLE